MRAVRGIPGLFIFATVVSLGAAWLAAPAPAYADPAADLAAAESDLGEATSKLAAAKQQLQRRQRELRPIASRAQRLRAAADRAEARVESVAAALRDERLEAAEVIAEAREKHDDEESRRDTLVAAGIALIAIAVLAAIVAVVLRRRQKWPLSAQWTRVAFGGLGILFVGGIALIVLPGAPEEPRFTPEQLALAADAEGDPLDPPTPELERARAKAAPRLAAARSAAKDEARAKAKVARAQREVERAKRAHARAEQRTDKARSVVARLEREEEEEAAFREEAKTIDYDQLIKDASDYKGEKVVYTGQIFQIQEFAGESIILLSVTDEGYGFWTDNIWVDYAGEIDSAEEDIITVYGKITGSKEYETQIGGSTYVPRMTAKYIDE